MIEVQFDGRNCGWREKMWQKMKREKKSATNNITRRLTAANRIVTPETDAGIDRQEVQTILTEMIRKCC
jgi:hypothetical protein